MAAGNVMASKRAASAGLSMRAIGACLAVFAVVSAGVAVLSQRVHRAAPTVEECVAVATARAIVEPEYRAAYDADVLAAAIVSEQNLAALLPLQDGRAGVAAADDLRGCVHVAASRLSPSGEVTLSIACAQPSASQAAAVANGIALRFADQANQAARRTVERAYRAARSETQARQQALLAAHRAWERFLDRPLPPQSAAAQKIAPPAAPLPAIVPPNTIFPTAVAAQRKIDQLAQRRAELLRTVTEVHPAVRDIEAQIELAQAELASLPGGTVEQAAASPPALLPRETPSVAAQERPGYRQRKAVVGRAEDAVAAALGRERLAWSVLQNPPTVAVRFADPTQAAVQPALPLRAVLMPIAVGLAAALLALRIAESRSRSAQIRTVRQLERAAAVPVLGAVTFG